MKISPGMPVLVEADGDVALVAGDGELVGDRPALVRQLVPDRLRHRGAGRGLRAGTLSREVFSGCVRLLPSR